MPVIFACAPSGGRNSAPPAGSGTLVVYGFAPDAMSGECKLGIGPSGSQKIETYLSAGWGPGGQEPGYFSERLRPGAWDLFQIVCGDFGIDRIIGPRGYSMRAGTFRPYGTFSVPGDGPVFIGAIVMESAADSWHRFRVDTNAAAAGSYLREKGIDEAPRLSHLRLVD